MEVNLSNIAKHFHDDASAYSFLEAIRWPNGPVCPHCGVINHAYEIKPKGGTRKTRTGKVTYRRLWKCGDCRKQFSVLLGTVMEESRVSLSKWLLAWHLVCSSKNGISAHELHRILGVTYKTALFMDHRIRYALENAPGGSLLTGTVEADETYIGGKQTAEERREKNNKVPVVTLIERNGEACSQVMQPVTGKNVKEIVTKNVRMGSELMTDSSTVYDDAGIDYIYESVNHSAEELVRGNVHVNTAEGFFSQLKRSLDGTYHHVSEYHLPRYLAEFDYRYSNRKMKDGERTVKAIKKSAGKRLMYRQTVDRKRTE